MKYAVIFEKSSTGYGAYVPDLPGCVATGKTLAVTKKRIAEAIEMHLEGMREDGERISKPSTQAEYVTVSA
jgi:predicted RNase H-like HicB family nuclease